MNRTPSLFAGVEPLEVFAELLADLDADTGSGEFYGRIWQHYNDPAAWKQETRDAYFKGRTRTDGEDSWVSCPAWQKGPDGGLFRGLLWFGRLIPTSFHWLNGMLVSGARLATM